MKKILFSLFFYGCFLSGLNAFEHAGVDIYLNSGYDSKFYYSSYNNPNDIVFSGSFTYYNQDGAYADLTQYKFEGLLGKNISYIQNENLELGVNVLGGGVWLYRKLKSSLFEVSASSIAPKVVLDILGTYRKNIIFSAKVYYETYFQDLDGHEMGYELGVGYKFSNNFYTKTNLKIYQLGKNEKHQSASTQIGFTAGYIFKN